MEHFLKVCLLYHYTCCANYFWTLCLCLELRSGIVYSVCVPHRDVTRRLHWSSRRAHGLSGRHYGSNWTHRQGTRLLTTSRSNGSTSRRSTEFTNFARVVAIVTADPSPVGSPVDTRTLSSANRLPFLGPSWTAGQHLVAW